MAKYNYDTCHKGYFHGGINVELKLITCEDKIFILSILQGYILHWYRTYLIYIGMNRTYAMI